VRANLARHNVPRRVHVIAELPRNAAGKMVKRELRALVEEL
jgi:acyl-coenzyme A synthetase/AMP-(fatty) acid ligase